MKFKNGTSPTTVVEPLFEEPKTLASTLKMSVASVKKSERTYAEKIVLYAPEGWGKSTWASQAESPVFLSTEDGLKNIVVDKFPEPQSWLDILEAINALRNEDHRFKTLVVDTADWTEHLCQSYLLQRDNVKSIEDYGYGKGYVIAFEEWKRLLSPLDALRREKGMNIVFLAHSAIKTFNNPSGENYDRYEMKMDRRVSTLLKEWSDCVLFGNYDVAIDVKKGQMKGKGYGGDRIIHTNYSPAFDAKNRYGIKDSISSNFNEFWNLVKGGVSSGTETKDKN